MATKLNTHHFVPNATSDFVRPLGSSERFLHLYAQVYPVHFCLCAEVEGAIGSEAIRLALDEVRERHPILRVRIVDDRELGPVFYESDLPIEFAAIAAENAPNWQRVVEYELRKPIDIRASSLLRVTALCASEATTIVLTFYHAIADALSAVWVFQDMMRALAGELLTAFSSLSSIDEKLLRPSHGPAPVSEADPIASSLCDIRSTTAMIPDNFRTNIVTVEFSREETSRLLEHCRANGTTAHGAICAAASRLVPASDHNMVRMVCPFDLRKMAGVEDGVCGVFIGAGSVEVPLGGTTSIWHDAQHIVRSLAQSRSPDAVIDFMSRMSAEFPPTVQREKLRSFFSIGPQSSLVVSNLGVLPIAEQYGNYSVKAVWAPAMLTNLPEDRQTIGASTFGGRLRIVHQSYVPIQGLATTIRETLLTVCC